MDNQVYLWQLISDWIEQTDLEWRVVAHGETHLIENIHDHEYNFYIADQYVSSYPSCIRDNLIAADPEFFDKLEDLLLHVDRCEKCRLLKEFNKMQLSDWVERVVTAKMTEYNFTKLVSAYALPPLRYPTIRIDP